MTGSLRKRLLLETTLTFVVILGLLGFAVDAAVRQTLITEFDDALRARADSLASMVEQTDGRVTFEFDIHDMPEFDKGPHPAYFQLWLNQKLDQLSPSLNNRPLFSTPPSPATSFRPLTLPDGTVGRAVFFSFAAHPEADDSRIPRVPAALVVARGTLDLDRRLSTVRWTLFTLCLLAVALSEAALILVVRRALRPVHRMAAQIEQVGETTLSTRLDSAEVPTELRPIVDRLNGLLERLEAAFDRERAFTADVAHELRTPIAGLRATFEVCRSRPREPAAYTAAIDRAMAITASMQTVIENLLLLARAESGELRTELSPIDLVNLLRETWTTFAPRAAERGLSTHWQLPAECPAQCDLPTLRIILTNLFDNAVSYADSRGAIDIALRPGAESIEIQIANTGNLVSPCEVPRLFQRFWRKDESRSQTGVHAGLGLSLCQRLAALLHGRISIEVEDDRFIATVVVPRLAPAPSPAFQP